MKIFLLVSFIVGSLVARAQTQTPPVKEWTFLVYLNADNNLYNYGLRNLEQMKAVGSNPDLNVVVEMDPLPNSLPTQRLYIEKGKNPTVLASFPETNMGDAKHLADFISWGVQNFPARHYALVIWNHGNGWHGVSYDDHPTSFMTIPALAQALRAAKQNLRPTLAQRNRLQAPLLDIVNFDACLMSTIEVAYELRDLTSILIGSQFLEPGEGEDYKAILSRLVAEPRLNSRDLAAHMVNEYVREFPNAAEINYVALDMTKVEGFTKLFRTVAAQHLTAPPELQRKLRHFYTHNLNGDDLVGGLTGARKMSGEGPFAQSLDEILSVYGYPAEKPRDASRAVNGGVAFNIHRSYPSRVMWRASMAAPVTTTELAQTGEGDYAATITVTGPFQYVVERIRPGTSLVIAREATSTYLRWGANPIVFNHQFPENSPVIAEAHSLETMGATGMSLYYSAASRLRRDVGEREVPKLASEYMQLSFARQGAPEWTKFIGL